MDPISRQLLKVCQGMPETIEGIDWEGTNDSDIAFSGKTASSSASGNGAQTYSKPLPNPDANGYYFDVLLNTGADVIFGISRGTQPVYYESTSSYTGLNVDGAVYGPAPNSSGAPTPLTTLGQITRLALRWTPSGLELYFVQPGRFASSSAAGPFGITNVLATEGLHFIVMRAGAFSLSFPNQGRIFKGGGGLF